MTEQDAGTLKYKERILVDQGDVKVVGAVYRKEKDAGRWLVIYYFPESDLTGRKSSQLLRCSARAEKIERTDERNELIDRYIRKGIVGEGQWAYLAPNEEKRGKHATNNSGRSPKVFARLQTK